MRVRAASGYTILEVILFIAISSSMFLLALISFSGRQQQVQFRQAVRELDAKITDTINDITTGYYPNDGRLTCSVPLAAVRPELANAGTPVSNGTNNNCVHVGKMIQFAVDDGVDATVNEELIYTYNMIGRRLTPGGLITQSLAEAKPIAVSPTTPAGFTDTVEKARLNYGLRVTRVYQLGSGIDIGAIGFFTGFARGAGTAVVSEGQTVKAGAIPDTAINQTQYAAVNVANTITDSTTPLILGERFVDTSSQNPIIICLTDASQRRKASITVGGGGSALTKVDFDTYNTAVCGI
jgi:hypothetical protein